ncbi:hypothetical protein GCM10009578_017070 [Streptomyces rhizosphaericus]
MPRGTLATSPGVALASPCAATTGRFLKNRALTALQLSLLASRWEGPEIAPALRWGAIMTLREESGMHTRRSATASPGVTLPTGVPALPRALTYVCPAEYPRDRQST